MLWPLGIRDAVADAIDTARGGTPTVLDIRGSSGSGKSSLLQTIEDELTESSILRATADEPSSTVPLAIVRQWGVDIDRSVRNSLAAAQALGQRVDAMQAGGPVTLILDDLQWADPESLDATGLLVSRAAGLRLLVVTTHRAHGPRQNQWSEVLQDLSSRRLVDLPGLDDAQTLSVIREFDSGADERVARALRAHTGGNPLFVKALLREYSVADLTALASHSALPAPEALIAAIEDRIHRLEPAAVAVLHALAVLGDPWSPLTLVQLVSGVDDPRAALRVLRAEDLVAADYRSATPLLRITHPVVRAAVYERLPRLERDGLHWAAMAGEVDSGARLQHRAAAVHAQDEELARDLEAHADVLHQNAWYREAAHFRRLASGVSSPADRIRRRLNADFESILARDLVDVSASAESISDEPVHTVVLGAFLATSMRWARAADVLEQLTDDAISGLSPLWQYRARVLRGWAIVAAGRSASASLRELELARECSVSDPAMAPFVSFAAGQAQQRSSNPADRVPLSKMMTEDRASLAASSQGLSRLAWRGSMMALAGAPDEAVKDLTLLTTRFGGEMVDFSDGVLYALLGFAQFLAGSWGHASISIEVANAGRGQARHPMSVSTIPLAAVIAGDAHRAREALAAARVVRTLAPLPAAIQLGDIVEVLVLALVGSETERRAWLSGRVADFGDPAVGAPGHQPSLWYLAQAIGAGWAGHQSSAALWCEALLTKDPPTWAPAAAMWLRACAGNESSRAARLGAAAESVIPHHPTLTTIVRLEAWKMAAAQGLASATHLRGLVESAFRTVDARALLGELIGADAPVSDPFESLSERERDVVTLLLDGLSYSQIAAQLFVTPSTVSFHLGKVYAKTNTRSRFELATLART